MAKKSKNENIITIIKLSSKEDMETIIKEVEKMNDANFKKRLEDPEKFEANVNDIINDIFNLTIHVHNDSGYSKDAEVYRDYILKSSLTRRCCFVKYHVALLKDVVGDITDLVRDHISIFVAKDKKNADK